MLSKLDKWHKTTQGHLVFGIIELVLAYFVASMALDSGSLLEWTLAAVLGLGALQNFVKAAHKKFKKG